MKQNKLTTLLFVVVMAFALAGCEGDATIVENIISTQILGDADDADSTTPADRYKGLADLDAEDQRTRALSVEPKFNEVSGKAEAESLDPAANTVTGDEALANSFNKVVSELQVSKKGTFTFDITFDVDRVEIRHNGTVAIQVAAAILNNQGIAVPNGGIANIDFEFRQNADGDVEVILNGDMDNPDSVPSNGNYNRKLSGPGGGVKLVAGNYRLELDLRIRARAPVLIGEDGQRHRAAVKEAKATIALR
jgi:hypothetical protein